MDTLLLRLQSILDEAEYAGVQLSTVVPQEDGFIMAGTATTHSQVLLFAANLRGVGLFAQEEIDLFSSRLEETRLLAPEEIQEFAAVLGARGAFSDARVMQVGGSGFGDISFTVVVTYPPLDDESDAAP